MLTADTGTALHNCMIRNTRLRYAIFHCRQAWCPPDARVSRQSFGSPILDQVTPLGNRRRRFDATRGSRLNAQMIVVRRDSTLIRSSPDTAPHRERKPDAC